MYQVSNHPRCLESCRLLYAALMELLLQGTPIERLSVSAIAARAKVSRATFYHHFDAPIDVLAWAVERETKLAFRGGEYLAEGDIASLTGLVFRYWVERSDLLEVLLRNGRYNLFVNALHASFDEHFGAIIDRSSVSEDVKPYLLSIYPAVTSAILRTWIERGKRESAKKLTSISLHNNTYPR